MPTQTDPFTVVFPEWYDARLEVETPSWGYGNSGTRFKVFPQPGVPRNPFEKIEDAASVGRYTGVAKAIALHIPWDKVDDYAELAKFADDRGMTIGAMTHGTIRGVQFVPLLDARL